MDAEDRITVTTTRQFAVARPSFEKSENEA